MKKILLAMAIMAFLAIPVLAADPTHIEDRMTTSISLTNNIGRAYDIEGVMFKTYVDATANSITVSVVNAQDTDLTGTNATSGSITYPVKVLDFAIYTNWTADVLIRVPDAAILKIEAGSAMTNDFLIFRDDSND